MGPWVDTHCHLQLVRETPQNLLDRASDVGTVVVPGIDHATSLAGAALVAAHPSRLRYAAGLHPHEAAAWPTQREALLALMGDACAIGETGLDFYRNLSPPEAQRQSFIDQLRIAHQMRKAVIVHCRDAFRDIHEILEAEGAGPSVVLHCWTGGPKWSRRFAELDVTFSFAGPVAFETGDTVRRGAAVIEPSSVVVETDTPYLAPPPHRGEDNEPAHVALVGAALAAVWGVTVGAVATSTTARAAAVFRL